MKKRNDKEYEKHNDEEYKEHIIKCLREQNPHKTEKEVQEIFDKHYEKFITLKRLLK